MSPVAAKVSPIRQAVSQESLFRVLSEWCRDGAGRKNWTLRILSAFVSGNGVRALAPLFDIFLADGNHLEIIFGVDRGGTNREALHRLNQLRRLYRNQASVKLFRAPASGSIFHPKLYLLDTGRELRAVVGSSNLTIPGLSTNLESLIHFERLQPRSSLGRAVMTIWNAFAAPVSPLKPEFLEDLTNRVVERCIRSLPGVHPEERHVGQAMRSMWSPLSRVKLPRSDKTIVHPPDVRLWRRSHDYLVMDVLNETRQTQMQIPLPVVEQFFGIAKAEEQTISVSILTDDGLTQPILRNVVRSVGRYQKRLMRRLEMPQTKGLQRPLAVIFIRLAGRAMFAYTLVEQSDVRYRKINQLLEEQGQQGGKVRRFLVGKVGDRRWQAVRSSLPGMWRTMPRQAREMD